MELYGLSAEEYMRLDIIRMSPQDLKELAYYLWCCHEDDETLMLWREKTLMPLVLRTCPAEEPMPEGDDEQ